MIETVASGAKKLSALTGLRFIASAMIVFHHGFEYMKLPAPLIATGQGVSFFFVLSGFVLAYSYPVLASRNEIFKFWIMRIARIWPAHALTTIVAALWSFKFTDLWALKSDYILLSVFSMTHAWVPLWPWYFAYNSPSWSISTEFFFYLAFPLLIFSAASTWWWKLLLCGFLLFGLMGLGTAYNLPIKDELSLSLLGIIYINPLGRLLEFMTGISACLAFHSLKNSAYSFPQSKYVFSVLEVLLVGATIYLLYSATALPSGQQGSWLFVVMSYLAFSSCFPIFACIILVFAFERGLLSNLMGTRIFVLLGEISFSLYLVHSMVFRIVRKRLDDVVGLGWPGFFVGFLLSILVSYIIWKCLEIPARNAVKKWLSKSATFGTGKLTVQSQS